MVNTSNNLNQGSEILSTCIQKWNLTKRLRGRVKSLKLSQTAKLTKASWWGRKLLLKSKCPLSNPSFFKTTKTWHISLSSMGHPSDMYLRTIYLLIFHIYFGMRPSVLLTRAVFIQWISKHKGIKQFIFCSIQAIISTDYFLGIAQSSLKTDAFCFWDNIYRPEVHYIKMNYNQKD